MDIGGWNKIEDEVPNSDRDVLVSDGHGCMFVGWLYDGERELFTPSNVTSYGDSVEADTIGVMTHWMELPEKPE